MKLTKNIFFAGKAGAGKTFCAKHVRDKYGLIPCKFAFPVYAIAEHYFGMTKKDRVLLQFIGTDVGRHMIDNDIWVKRLVQDVKIAQETSSILFNKPIAFVSDDTRFANESKALLDAGWLGVYLYVPDDIRIQRLGKRDGDAQVHTLQHASETAVDSFKNDLILLDTSDSTDCTHMDLDKILKSCMQDSDK